MAQQIQSSRSDLPGVGPCHPHARFPSLEIERARAAVKTAHAGLLAAEQQLDQARVEWERAMAHLSLLLKGRVASVIGQPDALWRYAEIAEEVTSG